MHVANCSNLEAGILNWTTDHTKSGIAAVFTASLFLLVLQPYEKARNVKQEITE